MVQCAGLPLAMVAMTETTRHPLGLAFGLTPLLTPLAFFPICAVYFWATGEYHAGSSWLASLGFFYLFGVPLGYVAIGVLGWPWITLLRHWHQLSAGYVCLGAGIIGVVALAGLITLLGAHPNAGAVFTSGLTIVGGLMAGLLSGLIFCLISGIPWKARA